MTPPPPPKEIGLRPCFNDGIAEVCEQHVKFSASFKLKLVGGRLASPILLPFLPSPIPPHPPFPPRLPSSPSTTQEAGTRVLPTPEKIYFVVGEF